MKISLCRCLAVLAALTLTLTGTRAAQYLGFDDYSLDWQNNGSVAMPARLYVPSNYNPAQKYPLIIMLHGSGEPGTNNTSPLDAVADSLVPKVKQLQYFMYVPQAPPPPPPPNNVWSWGDYLTSIAMRQAAYAMANYNIDPTRIYVTGYSLGGGGAKNTMNAYTRAIAATVPVCGTADADFVSSPRLTDKPIWAFHGELDSSQVPVSGSRNYIQSIISAAQAQGKTPTAFNVSYPNNIYYNYNWDGHLRYTEFKGADHFIWGRVYSESDNLGLFAWLGQQAVDINQASLRPGESAYFNFGEYDYTPMVDPQGRTWNTIGGYTPINTKTGLFPFALNSSGTTTSVCISSITKAFSDFTGTGQGYSRPGYEDDKVRDGWTTPPGTTEASPVVLKITGLVPGVSYVMDAYASHVASGTAGRWTRYRFDSVISGSTQIQYGDLNADGNTSGTSVNLNVTAGDDGTVLFKIFPAPGKSSTTAQLNTLSITRSGSTAPSNQAPVVDAGPNATTTLYEGITLTGTASDDGKPTGSTLTTTWSQTSGPGTVTFSNTAALSTTASFSAPGVYVLKLTASDSALSSSDTVTVTVNEWKDLDIGTVPFSGTSVVASGTAVVTGSGPNIWQNNDDFHFTFRPITGNCTFVVRQVSHPYQHWNSKAGIMLRGSLGRDASHAYVGMQPGGVGTLFMDHEAGEGWAGAGQCVGTVPYWLKITRVGNTLTTAISPDGSTWHTTSSRTVTLGATAYIGFAMSSADNYTLTCVYDNITISQP